MKKFITYYIFFGLFLFLGFYLFIPEKSNAFQSIELLIIMPIIFYFLLPSIIRKNQDNLNNLNLGLIFFLAMTMIMIIGNISNNVIKYIYPFYDDDIRATNLYYMGGLVFFSIGFLMHKAVKIKIDSYKSYLAPITMKHIIILTLISLFATLFAYVSLGFIPFIGGIGTGERFTNYSSNSLSIRFWSLCVIAAIFAFIYFRFVNKSIIAFLFFILASLISAFFLIRMYPFLIGVSVFLIWFSKEINKKRRIVLLTLLIAFYFVGNMLFVDYREKGNNLNDVRLSQSLSFIQRNLFYTNFNEYGQLKTAINTYTAEAQYGKTLLSIPIGFVPAPILLPFGIVKSDIQRNNSAVILADFLGSKSSTGLRIGIMGEFYINFKFFGFIFMAFIGLLVAYIQKKINTLNVVDIRYSIYIIIYVLLLYSLIGQVDAIGSLLGNYILLFVLIWIFSNKRKCHFQSL